MFFYFFLRISRLIVISIYFIILKDILFYNNYVEKFYIFVYYY